MRPKVYERDGVRLEVRGRRGSLPSSVTVTAHLPVEGWRVRWRLDPVTLRPVGEPTFLEGVSASEPSSYVGKLGRFERFQSIIDGRIAEARADGYHHLSLKTRSRRGGERGIDVALALKLRAQKLSSKEIAERLDCTPGAVRTALRRAGQVRARNEYLAQFATDVVDRPPKPVKPAKKSAPTQPRKRELVSPVRLAEINADIAKMSGG